jgi:hypothetical protein
MFGNVDEVGEDYSTAQPSPAKRRSKERLVKDGVQIESVLAVLNSKMAGDGVVAFVFVPSRLHWSSCLCVCPCVLPLSLWI